ncbi:MAG: aldehyde dehydrogenase, partial [Burkholderiales bacterium]|nr:aldehyde dehydrogenase [Burkholderiales bacterium]
QRTTMIQAIKQLFVNSEVQPTSGGTVAGAAHRVFVDLKSLITGKDEVSILKEVERGEKHLLEVYKDTMNEIKEPLVLNLLHKQYEEIQADLIKWQEVHHSLKV